MGLRRWVQSQLFDSISNLSNWAVRSDTSFYYLKITLLNVCLHLEKPLIQKNSCKQSLCDLFMDSMIVAVMKYTIISSAYSDSLHFPLSAPHPYYQLQAGTCRKQSLVSGDFTVNTQPAGLKAAFVISITKVKCTNTINDVCPNSSGVEVQDQTRTTPGPVRPHVPTLSDRSHFPLKRWFDVTSGTAKTR